MGANDLSLTRVNFKTNFRKWTYGQALDSTPFPVWEMLDPPLVLWQRSKVFEQWTELYLFRGGWRECRTCRHPFCAPWCPGRDRKGWCRSRWCRQTRRDVCQPANRIQGHTEKKPRMAPVTGEYMQNTKYKADAWSRDARCLVYFPQNV